MIQSGYNGNKPASDPPQRSLDVSRASLNRYCQGHLALVFNSIPTCIYLLYIIYCIKCTGALNEKKELASKAAWHPILPMWDDQECGSTYWNARPWYGSYWEARSTTAPQTTGESLEHAEHNHIQNTIQNK